MRLMERAILQIFHSVAFFTGNRVARAGADGSSVLGTIFYKSSDPKRLKYIPARRHILPFSTGKYVSPGGYR